MHAACLPNLQHPAIESSFFTGNWPLMGGGSFVDQRRMTQSIICHRAFEFAVRTVKLCERMAARGFGARNGVLAAPRDRTLVC
jgi:hypothetical protein